MNLYCAEWRAFGNFFHALSTLKEDKRQRLVPAYGAGRWASKQGCTPASPTRAYKECARHFVTFPIDEFRTSCIDHELGCTLQTLEMEKCQISPDDIKKCGVLTEEQMGSRTKVRALHALVSTTNGGKKRMEFVNRDFNAAVNVRRCAVLEKRPPEWTRENFVGQSLKVELYEKKLESGVGGRSEKTGRRLHDSRRPLVEGTFTATTIHVRRRSTLERRLIASLMTQLNFVPCVRLPSQKCTRYRACRWIHASATTPVTRNPEGKLPALIVQGILAFPPTAWLLKRIGRAGVVKRAEEIGVPWRENVRELRLKWDTLEQKRARLVERDLVYPDYYVRAPFHTYPEGNLGWIPAMEVESSALAVHARLFPEAPPTQGDRLLRDTFLDRVWPRLEQLLVPMGRPLVALDLGASTGLSTMRFIDAWLARYPERPLDITGIDLSTFMLAVAELRAEERSYPSSIQVRFKHAAVENLPQKADSVDLVLCSLVTHELPMAATERLVVEAYRVLRPGGMLAMMDSDPHSEAFRSIPPVGAAIFRSTEPYFSEYERVDMVSLLTISGFTDVHTENNTPRHRVWLATKPLN